MLKVPYIMETNNDCGPRLFRAKTGLDIELIFAKWPGQWGGSDLGRYGVPNDTPWDHFQLLETLNIKYMIVPFKEIKGGDVVLFHYVSHEQVPDFLPTILKRLITFMTASVQQHWIIVDKILGNDVWIFKGSSEYSVRIDKDMFDKLYHDGWPNCAYRIGEGDHKLEMWQKIVADLTGKIF